VVRGGSGDKTPAIAVRPFELQLRRRNSHFPHLWRCNSGKTQNWAVPQFFLSEKDVC